MTKEPLVEGEDLRVWVHFRDPVTQEYADPVLPVTVRIDPPAAEPMPPTRVLEAVRLKKGVFVADTLGDIVGWWNYRAESSPPGVGAVEGTFEVLASRMR